MISNLNVLDRLLNEKVGGREAETDDGDERPPPKLRSKLGLFLALVALTALGEVTVRGIRNRRRKRATQP